MASAFQATSSGSAISQEPRSGNDKITGSNSTALINGGAGNDTLAGVAGHSTLFLFDSRDPGSDVISNFHAHSINGASGDVIELAFYGIRSFSALVASGELVQSGSSTLVQDAGHHTIVTLQNTDWHSLSSADFLFVG